MKISYSLYLLLSVGEYLNLAHQDVGIARQKLARLAGSCLGSWSRELGWSVWRNEIGLGGAR